MANERIKMITMQIKNGVCLLCIFALMLLFAACFSLHTTQAEVRSFSVILLLVIGLLLMSVLALIAFLRYKMLRNKQHFVSGGDEPDDGAENGECTQSFPASLRV